MEEFWYLKPHFCISDRSDHEVQKQNLFVCLHRMGGAKSLVI